MEVKQVYVTRENPGKIFSIIEDELLEQINTQRKDINLYPSLLSLSQCSNLISHLSFLYF